MKIFTSKNYPKVYIKLKPSKTVKGEIGAFALMDFSKGKIIVRSKEFEDDNVMSVNEYNKLSKDIKNMVKAHSTIDIDRLYIPKNINYLRPLNYFNHSCDPNVGFDSKDNYVSIKNIKKGDEFLLDYSFLNTNPDYKMICHCGSKNCRHIITGNEWVNKDFVKQYQKYFASTLRNILALHNNKK